MDNLCILRRRFLLCILFLCIFIILKNTNASKKPSSLKPSSGSRKIYNRRYTREAQDRDDSEFAEEDDFQDEDESEDIPRSKPKKAVKKTKYNERAPARSKNAPFQRKGRTSTPGNRALVAKGRKVPVTTHAQNVFAKIKEKAASAGDEASTKYKELARIAKGVVSSNYERFVLQITWPDDEPVPEVDFQDLLDTFGRFPKGKSFDKQNNVYRATLRKLWARMTEKDWRTVVKAIYVLNRIARNANPKDSSIFSKELKAMSRETNPKSSEGYPYFNFDQLMALSPTGQPYKNFVSAYALFAFRRVSKFTGRFEELAAVNEKCTQAKACQMLKDASLVITIALECKLTRQQLNPVTQQALVAMLKDVIDLWKATCKALTAVCADECSVVGKKAKASKQELRSLLEFYTSTRPKLEKFLELMWGLLGGRKQHKLALVNPELLAAKLAEVSSLEPKSKELETGESDQKDLQDDTPMVEENPDAEVEEEEEIEAEEEEEEEEAETDDEQPEEEPEESAEDED